MSSAYSSPLTNLHDKLTLEEPGYHILRGLDEQTARSRELLIDVDRMRDAVRSREKLWHQEKESRVHKYKLDVATREASLQKSPRGEIDQTVGLACLALRQQHDTNVHQLRKDCLTDLVDSKRTYHHTLAKQQQAQQVQAEIHTVHSEKKAQEATFLEKEQAAEELLQKEREWRDEREQLMLTLEAERWKTRVKQLQTELDNLQTVHSSKEAEWQQELFKERALRNEQHHALEQRQHESDSTEDMQNHQLVSLTDEVSRLKHLLHEKERVYHHQLIMELQTLEENERVTQQQVLSNIEGMLQHKEQEYNAKLKIYEDTMEAAVVMNEMLRHEGKQPPQPNPSRCSMLWALVEQAFYYLGRFQPMFVGVLRRVLEETLQTVYIKPPTLTPDSIRPLHLAENQTEVVWRPVEAKYGVPTWFDSMERLSRNVGDMESRLKMKDHYLKTANSQITELKAKLDKTHHYAALREHECDEEKLKNTKLQKKNAELETKRHENEDKLSRMDMELSLTLNRVGNLQQQQNHKTCKVRYQLAVVMETCVSSGLGCSDSTKLLVGIVKTGASRWMGADNHLKLRENGKHLLDEAPGLPTILQWMKYLVKHHPCSSTLEKAEIDIAVPSTALLDTWLAVMQVLAPTLFTLDESRNCIASDDLAAKADVLVKILKGLNAPTCHTVEDILVPDGYYCRLAALKALFQWFCDPTSGDMRGVEPSNDDTYSTFKLPGTTCTDSQQYLVAVRDMKRWKLHGMETDKELDAVVRAKLTEMMSNEPKAPQEIIERALQYRQDADLKKCIQLLERGIAVTPASDPAQAEMYFIRGYTKHHFLRPKDMSGALQDYNRAISQQPCCAEAWRQKADIQQYDFEQCQDSIDSYDNAILHGSAVADTFNNRGEAYMKLQNWEHALKDIEEALKANPAHEKAKKNLEVVKPMVIGIQRKAAEEVLQTTLAALPVISFEKNDAKLDAEDVAGLNAVAEIMGKYPLVRIRVVGITTNHKMVSLAERRAEVCTAYIVKKGVLADRLEIIGKHGERKATEFEPL